ncbi:MAG: hypothetical protein QW061_02175 [Candidatus Rehaiarchaeum fermentans]|nr:hypothetical protein [Candidatus Rehaiarchaeum fermentans]MCW1297450.1 hypothetical protein [Candidatus Rehaiarchaeum fermentans]
MIIPTNVQFNLIEGLIIPALLLIFSITLLIIIFLIFIRRFSSATSVVISRIALIKGNWWKISIILISPGIGALFSIIAILNPIYLSIYLYFYGALIVIILIEILIFVLLEELQKPLIKI